MLELGVPTGINGISLPFAFPLTSLLGPASALAPILVPTLATGAVVASARTSMARDVDMGQTGLFGMSGPLSGPHIEEDGVVELPPLEEARI